MNCEVNLKKDEKFESLGEGFFVATSKDHKFGTDSFLLCDFAKILKKDVVADFGAGSGIVSILIYKKYTPKKIYSFEILESAVKLLKKSVAKSKLEDRILVLKKDIKKIDKQFFGKFDRIVCNPPYKALNTGIISKSSVEKITRHETLLTIDDVCKKAAQLLKWQGSLILSSRVERMCEVFNLMQKYKIEPKTLQLCAKSSKKKPWLFLVEGKKGGKPFLNVLPNYFLL